MRLFQLGKLKIATSGQHELTYSAQWGFHPGGWGKPPMDDFNRPLYGDVFGVLQGAEIAGQEEIDRSLWGEIEPMEGTSS
jgi:splicing factor 3B subunit 2